MNCKSDMLNRGHLCVKLVVIVITAFMKPCPYSYEVNILSIQYKNKLCQLLQQSMHVCVYIVSMMFWVAGNYSH